MSISRRSVLLSALGSVTLGALGAECSRALSTPEWVSAASASSAPLAIGVALGSGYQSYFTSLSSMDQQKEIKRMQVARITWVRMDVQWGIVQPTATGGFDWSVPDAAAAAMLAGNMNVVILLSGSPVWARAAAGTTSLHSPWPTPDPQLYAEFCAALFVYCWSDAGGGPGPYGLVRADGTPKPALAALTTAVAVLRGAARS